MGKGTIFRYVKGRLVPITIKKASPEKLAQFSKRIEKIMVKKHAKITKQVKTYGHLFQAKELGGLKKSFSVLNPAYGTSPAKVFKRGIGESSKYHKANSIKRLREALKKARQFDKEINKRLRG